MRAGRVARATRRGVGTVAYPRSAIARRRRHARRAAEIAADRYASSRPQFRAGARLRRDATRRPGRPGAEKRQHVDGRRSTCSTFDGARRDRRRRRVVRPPARSRPRRDRRRGRRRTDRRPRRAALRPRRRLIKIRHRRRGTGLAGLLVAVAVFGAYGPPSARRIDGPNLRPTTGFTAVRVVVETLTRSRRGRSASARAARPRATSPSPPRAPLSSRNASKSLTLGFFTSRHRPPSASCPPRTCQRGGCRLHHPPRRCARPREPRTPPVDDPIQTTQKSPPPRTRARARARATRRRLVLTKRAHSERSARVDAPRESRAARDAPSLPDDARAARSRARVDARRRTTTTPSRTDPLRGRGARPRRVAVTVKTTSQDLTKESIRGRRFVPLVPRRRSSSWRPDRATAAPRPRHDADSTNTSGAIARCAPRATRRDDDADPTPRMRRRE